MQSSPLVREQCEQIRRDSKARGVRPVIGAFLLFLGSAVLTYALWVCCSYLFVPFQAAEYSIPTPYWPQDGYSKFRPGRYENPRYATVFSINRHGFRGRDFSSLPDTRTRIVIVGESSTMGLESNDNETWPYLLENQLRERGLSVEVINAGISGAKSSNHAAMMKDILNYKPDVLLYYAGRNDEAISEWERYPGRELFPDGFQRFLRHWFLYKRVQVRTLGLALTTVDIDDWLPWSNARWTRDYKANLTSMVRSSRPVPFIIIPQWLHYPAETMPSVLAGRKRELAQPLSMSFLGWTALLRHLDLLNIQRRVAQEEHAVMIDTYSALQKLLGEPLFYDQVHLTPHGNARLAEAVADAIEPMIDTLESD